MRATIENKSNDSKKSLNSQVEIECTQNRENPNQSLNSTSLPSEEQAIQNLLNKFNEDSHEGIMALLNISIEEDEDAPTIAFKKILKEQNWIIIKTLVEIEDNNKKKKITAFVDNLDRYENILLNFQVNNDLHDYIKGRIYSLHGNKHQYPLTGAGVIITSLGFETIFLGIVLAILLDPFYALVAIEGLLLAVGGIILMYEANDLPLASKCSKAQDTIFKESQVHCSFFNGSNSMNEWNNEGNKKPDDSPLLLS